jgi:sulfite oxidase
MNTDNPNFPKPNLKTLSLIPENQETPIHFLRTWITLEKYFYRRNHFSYPRLTSQAFSLPVAGEVDRNLIFSYDYLRSMNSRAITMTLECSGNRRSYFDPKTYGEQWEDGAISQGVWRGVPLKDLLVAAGLKNSAKEVVFVGYDYGKREDMEGTFNYARSLPLDKATDSDTIVAYELNGKPIPFEQGFPLRLVVPGWYGMASVKWLKQVTVINHDFKGPYQDVDYVYYPHKDSDEGKRPVTTIKTDSIIQQPLNYSILDTGTHKIQGVAWTGTGTITEVELSFNKGHSWLRAELEQDFRNTYSWTFWSYKWDVQDSGEYNIMCRARDSTGYVQPAEAEWNRKGYGYNAIYTINVKVE